MRRTTAVQCIIGIRISNRARMTRSNKNLHLALVDERLLGDEDIKALVLLKGAPRHIILAGPVKKTHSVGEHLHPVQVGWCCQLERHLRGRRAFVTHNKDKDLLG